MYTSIALQSGWETFLIANLVVTDRDHTIYASIRGCYLHAPSATVRRLSNLGCQYMPSAAMQFDIVWLAIISPRACRTSFKSSGTWPPMMAISTSPRATLWHTPRDLSTASWTTTCTLTSACAPLQSRCDKTNPRASIACWRSFRQRRDRQQQCLHRLKGCGSQACGVVSRSVS